MNEIDTQNLFLFLLGVVTVGFIVIGYVLFDIKKKWDTIFGKAKNEKELLADILTRCKETSTLTDQHETRIKVLEAISQKSIQKVGFLRFNPFPEMGGDNSFALSLLDRENNGVIISSLYMRDGVRVYSKLVEKGVPKHPLSNEEQKSLAQALSIDSKQI